MKITFTVNGKSATVNADDPQMPLLYALRDDLGLRREDAAPVVMQLRDLGAGFGEAPAPEDLRAEDRVIDGAVPARRIGRHASGEARRRGRVCRFALSQEPCGGGTPPCLAEGVRLTTGQRCYVAVTFTGPTLESERTLSFPSGRLDCPAARVEECRSFLAEVTLVGPKSIPLDPAPSEFETADGTSGTGDTDDTGSTDGAVLSGG